LDDAPARVMALDYGRRRIGLAVSDPTGAYGLPAGVVAWKGPLAGGGPLPPGLAAAVKRNAPSLIVVGLPFLMSGRAGKMASEAREFARAVELQTGVAVAEWDERLTSSRAERDLAAVRGRGRKAPSSGRRADGRHDQAAAALILSAFLQRAKTLGGDDNPDRGRRP